MSSTRHGGSRSTHHVHVRSPGTSVSCVPNQRKTNGNAARRVGLRKSLRIQQFLETIKVHTRGTIGTRPVLDRIWRDGGRDPPAPLWRTSIRVRSYPTREAPRRPSYTIPSRARTGRVFVAALTRARHLNNITRRVARRTTSNTCAHGGDPHDLTASGCQRSELPGKLLPA